MEKRELARLVYIKFELPLNSNTQQTNEYDNVDHFVVR